MSMFRDYSKREDEVRPKTFHEIDRIFFLRDKINYEKTIQGIGVDNWFASSFKPFIDFLKFSIEGNEASTLDALIYAYQHPGTAESLVRLCQGLFGADANITIDQSTPAVVGIEVENANENLAVGWITKNAEGVVDKNIRGSQIVFNDFQEVAPNSLYDLIHDFIPAGWELNFNVN